MRSPSPTRRSFNRSRSRTTRSDAESAREQRSNSVVSEHRTVNENTPLLHGEEVVSDHSSRHTLHDHDQENGHEGAHSHDHSHSHSHGSMNMRALVLHVLGDALGNAGVIATGLVIWFSSWPYRYYFDPVISLVITVIIFSSALPLGEPSRALCHQADD